MTHSQTFSKHISKRPCVINYIKLKINQTSNGTLVGAFVFNKYYLDCVGLEIS